MLGISGTELVLILFFGFLIFGPEKLPQMGRTIGRAIRQFRQASESMNQKFKTEVSDPFQEAVTPYTEEIQKQAAPIQEDLDAINKNLSETASVFTDPFKDALNPSASAKPAPTAAAQGRVTSGAAAPAKRAEDSANSSDPFADALSEKDDKAGQPIPEKNESKRIAASLYGLNDDDEKTEAAASADNAKGGE
ncbi:MAG: twin-arginine translocase TatA/TatE family subunit [Coriobacteriales bacterium]